MITIYARGARTLADARPLIHNGTGVYVSFDGDTANLYTGGWITAQRPASEITTIADAQDWAYELIEGADQPDHYEEAAAGIRAKSSAMLLEADAQDRAADEMAARPTKARENNHRHPKNKAARIRVWADHLRNEAALLAAWTAADERGYKQYVSDGLADTNGYYAPVTRAAWKHAG